MKCLIIDDELIAREILRKLCEGAGKITVMGAFGDALSAIKYLNQNEVDLLFLDIHMPNFNGFDLIKTLKNPPKIILTTSDPNFALRAFEYDFIIDYLLKPLEASRFEKAVEKAKQVLNSESEGPSIEENLPNLDTDFYINIDRRLIKIDPFSVYLVEAKGDYINIKTEDNNYRVHTTLKKIEEKLPESIFLKIHRSYVINLKKIIDIEDNSVLIKRDVVPISRSKRPELMRRLDLL
ncbi:MAG: LytR/AlgR family response regulator transcription factor [Polaribacter sp.]